MRLRLIRSTERAFGRELVPRFLPSPGGAALLWPGTSPAACPGGPGLGFGVQGLGVGFCGFRWQDLGLGLGSRMGTVGIVV